MRLVLEPQLPGCDRQEPSSVACSIGGFKEVMPARLPTLSSASRLGFCFPDLSVVLVFSCEENPSLSVLLLLF